MSIFDFLRGADITRGIEEYEKTSGAILLDVRTAQEYRAGHIPHAVNLPLDVLGEVKQKIDDKNVPLFVYCHSGARSRQASSQLMQMGYTRVHNIGGISGYRGKVEK